MPGFTDKLNSKKSFQKTVSKNAYGDDTVKLIVDTINTYSKSPFVEKTVEILSQGNPDKMEFLKRLFGVACKNVKYLADQPGHEVIYTPKLLMRMGLGDCKKFTVFISAVLKAKGYDAVTKVVKYDPLNDWQHIYVISRTEGNNYITLDPVNHCKFNSEVKFAKARLNFLDGTYSPIMDGNKLSLMGNVPTDADAASLMGKVNESANTILTDLSAITGVGHCRRSHHHKAAMAGLEEDYMSGINDLNAIYGDEDAMGYSEIGARKAAARRSGGGGGAKAAKKPIIKKAAARPKKTKEQKREKRQKFFKKLKKGNPAFLAARGAFLGLVKLGGALQKMKGVNINLASKLAQRMQDPAKAKPVLDIWRKFGGQDAALLKAIAQAGKSSMKGIGAEEQIMAGLEGMGVATAAAAAGLVTAAAPILVPIIKLLKKDKQVPEDTAEIIDNTLEVAENVALTQNGELKPEAITTLKNSKLIRESLDLDKGGNQETTREIAKEAAKETETPSSSPAAPAPKPAPSYVENQEQYQAQSSPAQNLPATVQKESGTTAAAKSSFSSLLLPMVWCRIILVLILASNFISFPTLFSILGAISVTGLIYTSVSLIFKNNPQWQKVN